MLFFGSSMVYCDVVPAIIWEETGLRSYVMAGPEQTIPITYYYLREACKTQSPQAVVIELTGDQPEYWHDDLHYNIYGAVPFSRRLGLRLMELDLDITDQNETLWQERLEAINTFS